jgi:hypothetical protein
LGLDVGNRQHAKRAMMDGRPGVIPLDRHGPLPPMPIFLAELFPLIYGLCFLLLLWQAFRVMGRGFRAMQQADAPPPTSPKGDRLGKLTIHPELLDANGQITQEDLLTVRFSDDNGEPVRPVE